MEEEVDRDEILHLEIFPNELWDKNLTNVTNVQDYHEISNTCDFFRSLLLPRAPEILFADVIKVLAEQYSNFFTETSHWIVARQVCHAWKRALDQMMQTPKYFTQNDNQRVSQICGISFSDQPLYVNYLRFFSAEEFTRFEEHFDPTHLARNMNPFLQRRVQLYIPHINDHFGPYFTACLQFLQKYGHHIWVCIINVNLLVDNLFEFYNQGLNSLLVLMPNLRALHIVPGISNIVHVPGNPAALPTLPHLEYIGVHSPSLFGLQFPVVQQLLQSNPQVQYVDLMNTALMPNVVLEQLPNLSALAFAIWNTEQVRGFINAQFTSSVERLWLNMCWPQVPTRQIFQALGRHFSESLRELHLSLPPRDNIGDRLVLPQLKSLHLEMEKPLRLDDMLVPLKDTLVELYLVMDIKPDHGNCHFEFTTEQGMLHVYKFWNEPQKSNIWSIFPKLTVLESKVFITRDSTEKYSCTRKEWQAELEEQ